MKNNANLPLGLGYKLKNLTLSPRKYSQICEVENFRGKLNNVKPKLFNKKGHFDLATLLVAVLGGAVAYTIAQKHLLKKYFNEESKNENSLRVRK
ncbi:MAG TPA: hypothetical protein VJI97_02230 [Candidatus Nanoarchaeia archaeon]|nr:hypothetical protein [Candidatus Nanoarchaeia archaeon]